MIKEPTVGMVQARVRITSSPKSRLLSIMQDIEFYTIINKMQNLREYTGTVAAAGNGQFNRLSAMDMLGEMPWSSCLLEDFDFSLRLLLSGWKTCLIQDDGVYQQGVTHYGSFIKQRARWAQGCMQCFSYLGKVIKAKRLSSLGKAEILSYLCLPWYTLLSSITLLFSWILILCMYISKSSILLDKLSMYTVNDLLLLLIIILVLVFLPGIIFSMFYKLETKETIIKTILIGLLVPIYNLLQIPSILIAFIRQSFNLTNWVKTNHE